MRRNYMSTFYLKYLTGVLSIMFVFGNFVACGTQLYRVSLEEDLDYTKVEAANPDFNNPESTAYGIHSLRGWQQIPIPIRFGYDLSEEQIIHFLAAVKKWEWAVGKNLFYLEGIHHGVTGDSFQDLYSSLYDGVNGQYLDNDWGKTDKPDYVLATAIWSSGPSSTIQTADIRFNYENYTIGDSLSLRATNNREVVDMLSLALHELGHLLGLAHVDRSVDSHSIMTPSLFIGEGLTSREISRGDIERLQLIYGCDGKACDIDYLVSQMRRGPLDREMIEQAELWYAKGRGLSPSDDDDILLAH